NLDENQIKSIKAMRNLNKLEKFSLSKNNISDVSPLSNLEKLTNFDLFGNEIKDVAILLEGKLSLFCTASLGGNGIPEEQLNALRKKIILLPNENEGTALSNMISIASCEINFQKDKGRYTSDIKEFVSSGHLMHRGNVDTLTLESIIRKYDVALFDVNEKGFTIVITPEKDVQGRIFAINEGGFVLEWLGDEDVNISKLNLDDDKWKAWPPDHRFSVYSCGSGG
ncbi:MAG: hypothetical protein KJ613_02765, partial [Nanoarchaeota archaeon]|nr:hypothetical protein [Nanoarchaeota archaeon]